MEDFVKQEDWHTEVILFGMLRIMTCVVMSETLAL